MFTTSPNPIQVKIGAIVLTSNITIVNQNTITAVLPSSQSFSPGSYGIFVSLNAGLNFTTETVTFTFLPQCPGSKK